MEYKLIETTHADFEIRPLENLRELLDDLERIGATHYALGYEQNEYPYIEFFKEAEEKEIKWWKELPTRRKADLFFRYNSEIAESKTVESINLNNVEDLFIKSIYQIEK